MTLLPRFLYALNHLFIFVFYFIFFYNNCTLSASYYCLYFVASDTYVVDKINHSSYKWLISIIYRGIALECGTYEVRFFRGFVQSVPLTNQNTRLARSFRRSRKWRQIHSLSYVRHVTCHYHTVSGSPMKGTRAEVRKLCRNMISSYRVPRR